MSVTDFFKKVGEEFKKVGTGIGHLFVHVFGKDATRQFVQAAEKILASDFGKVIVSILEGLVEFKNANGDLAAKAEAFSQIKTAAVGAGLDLKDSMVNLLIELAANKLNGTLGALSAASLKE
jgi:hypothetical protein